MTKPDATSTGHGGDRTSGLAQLTTKQKEARALELRTGGATYQQIADTLGFAGGAKTAQRMVKRALEAIPHEAVQELRQVELLRLDEVEMRLRQRLRTGDVSVANTLLRLADQRAKLTGIYQAPEGMGDLTAVQAVFGGLMASAQAFAHAQAQGELEELVVVDEAA